MSTATCDPEAFYPLERLVSGPFTSLDDLNAIERLLRTVVLHDEITMEITPLPDVGTSGPIDSEGHIRLTIAALAIRPDLTGYDFFGERSYIPSNNVELSQSLLELASQYSNVGPGHTHFDEHVLFLKRVFGVVQEGGSALLCGPFGRAAISAARRYPELMFQSLDEDWQRYAHQIDADGLDLLVPPVLGIVLTRCARRDAIPSQIWDLRNEWADARTKVWGLLDAQRTCKTLGEATEISKELADASRLFSPDSSELNTRPVRVLWEILAAGAAGAGVAALSGGKPAIGAFTGAVTQAARNVPAFTHEFGAMLFGRGAFDLARRVRRAVSKIELGALPRLLSNAERQKLGFK
ncbi:MAG TPA: hypothetical protein VE959_04600 [Bryobacteraceae bacterium]|nr:hypothetical protein [Bryobacteraceae bacterium]